MKQLTKLQVVVAILMSFVTPIVTALGSYNKSMHTMDLKIEGLRLEREEKFVKKDDFKRLSDKIDVMASDVAEIKGYLKRR